MQQRASAFLSICILLFSGTALARQGNKPALRKAIQKVIDTAGAKVGIAVMTFGNGQADSLQISGEGHFPMQSVYKLPLALAVLDQVEAGKLVLTSEITIQRATLDSNTWSPMLKDHRGPAITLRIADLLRYSVSKSDNNACDILFGLLGGPAVVQAYLEKIGIRDMQIRSTEREMHADGDLQYQNWSTPAAMLRLLERVKGGTLLPSQLNVYLMVLLTDTQNSANRISGALPDVRYVLAHKTGTSGTTKQGRTAAVNDAGILSYDGRRIGLVVFVSDLNGPAEKGEKIIAEISRLIWNYYWPETASKARTAK